MPKSTHFTFLLNIDIDIAIFCKYRYRIEIEKSNIEAALLQVAKHGCGSYTKYLQCVRNFITLHSEQAVRVATQYAFAPCKLTISSQLFARWRCYSGITIHSYLFARWQLFRHVGYLRHQQQVDL